MLRVGENVAWVSNSLDPDETSSYSASHPDPSYLRMGYRLCYAKTSYNHFGAKTFFRDFESPFQAASSAKIPDTIAHGRLPNCHVGKCRINNSIGLCYSKTSYNYVNIKRRKQIPKC